EDAEPGANDRLLSQRPPGQPDARGEVILVRLDDSGRDQSLFGVVEAIQRGWDVGRDLMVSDQAGGRVKISFLAALLLPGRAVFVAQAKIERQPLINSEVFLHEQPDEVRAVVGT